ncbi:MAG: PEGA domain-containing protein [Gemmatimonadetes bacterium]|nr:PEGA domain-containing protein [Gemmatimonadota bacterium]
MSKGVANYLLVVLCAFSLMSCGALFKGSTQTVSIKAFQQGATIEVDGQTYVSPALIELPRNQNYVVTISKEGYETQQVRINRTVSGSIVILDILGGVLPVVIDAVMGTWYNLSPGEINVNLESKQSGLLDIPVKITTTDEVSVKIESPQPVQIKIEKAE